MTNCPWCDATNRDGAGFCRRCGRLLGSACPACGAPADDDANFCDTCGRPLGPGAWLGAVGPGNAPRQRPSRASEEAPSALVTRRSSLVAPDAGSQPALQLEQFIPGELRRKLDDARQSGSMSGERRVVTMLFCDVKGSTALAGDLDPEEWSDIINAAFERMIRPVYHYEGTVARLMGDGLLAFFGAPIAHEDDPRRAVLAALEIVAGVAELRAALPRASDLDVRVGINTGLVVVGAVGSDLRLEYSALGDAINVAARMEQTATPGAIQITEDTLRLVAGQFDVEPLGGVALKGKAQPVSAYRVLRRKSAGEVRRFQSAFHSPLINRAREWELLQRAFEGLAGGRGGIVFLSGDAGLGKTRLIDECLVRLAADAPGARAFAAAAYSYETEQPYGLVVRLLRAALGVMAADAAETVAAALDDACAGAPDDERRALLILLGAAPEADGHALSGEAFARVLVSALASFWRHLAAAGPVVLALDDLQWSDASSVDLLANLFDLTERAPLLFLCALRRDRRSHGWRLKETAEGDYHHRFAESALYPLTDGESRMLLEGLLGDSSLPESLQALILDRAEGNPLFVEEVVHNLIERGLLAREREGAPWLTRGAVDSIELPDSLQALLTARIDRLDEDTRRVLQIAAVLGRSFARPALAALVDQPERLDRQLLELQRTDLIREVTRLPEPEYAFHHTLTHEATYNTILLRQRRALHRRAAEIIERLHGLGVAAPDDHATGLATDGVAAVAPRLAHHFLEGDAPDRALPYLTLAAAEALRLNAVAEAIATYNRALPIAIAQPGANEQVIALAVARGRALELQSRFADADAAYQALEQLALDRDHQPMQLAALIGQGKLRANVTPLYDPVVGRALMQRALTLAQALGDQTAEVRILWNLLNIDRFDVFTLEHSTDHAVRALALARELGLAEETAYLLNDLGEALGSLGRMDEARLMLGEAVEHWRALGNEPMLADGLTGAANWTAFSGDLAGGRALAEEAYAVNVRIGNPWGQAYSGAVRSLIASMQGEFGTGVAGLREAVNQAGAAGFVGGQVLARSFLSQMLLGVGQVDEAAEVASDGLVIGREQLPQFAGMCLARLALALLAQGDTEGAAVQLQDPLLQGTRQQAFVEIDVALAQIELALAQGRPDDALARTDDTIARLEAMCATIWEPGILVARAAALMALGRPAEARDNLATAATQSRQMGVRAALWRTLARLAEAEAALGRPAADIRREAAAELACVLDQTFPDTLRDSLRALPEALLLAREI